MISTCNELLSGRIITAKENGRKFVLNNNKPLTVNKVKVDGCYQTKESRCDYLFEIMSSNKKNIEKVFYVELKGCRLNDALEQLISTIEHCKSMHNDVEKIAIAILSRTPQMSSGIQNMQVKISKLTGNVPIIKNNIVEITI